MLNYKMPFYIACYALSITEIYMAYYTAKYEKNHITAFIYLLFALSALIIGVYDFWRK